MRMYKYFCKECTTDFFTDMSKADFCCNCGSHRIEEESFDDLDMTYIKRLLRNEILEV